MSRTARAVFACALMAATTVACSDPRAGDYPLPSDPVLTEAQISLPFEKYLLSEVEQLRLEVAAQRETNKCLRKYGEESILPAPQDALALSEVLFSRRYGLVDLNEAKIYGYGYASNQEPRLPFLPTRRQKEILTGVDADGRKTLERGPDGSEVPPSGCAGAARESLASGSGADEEFIVQAANETWAEVKTEHAFEQVTDEWSSCMYKNTGQRFKERSDAGDSLDAGAAKDELVKMAVADVRCAQEVFYVDRLYYVDMEVQNAYIKARIGTFREISARKTATLQRVADVLVDH